MIRCASDALSKLTESDTTGFIVPSSIISSSGEIHGSKVPLSSHRVSMLRPITVFDSPI